MLTPVLLLAVVVNIVGLLNNYNIKNHPLDIRVKREADPDLQDEIDRTTDNILKHTLDDEAKDEYGGNMDAAYTVEDVLLNYTRYYEAEATDEIMKDDETAPEDNLDDILSEAAESEFNKSEDKFQLIDNIIKNESELINKDLEELLQEQLDSNNTDTETDARVGGIILINKIGEGISKEETDKEDDNNFNVKEKEVIRELDEELINLKNHEDNHTEEGFRKYGNGLFDNKHNNMLLYIIFNLRNNNDKKEKLREKRYAAYGDRYYNTSPKYNGVGSLGYGSDPGYVGNTASGAAASNSINGQYPYYPYNVNSYPNYNRNYTNYYNNYNQQPNYSNYNPITPHYNQPYYNNTSYKPINPYYGNQNGRGYTDYYSNYYPMYNRSNTSRNTTYGDRTPGYRAPGYNGNSTLITNSTTSPVIVESCFMCGSFGCPKFFRKIGFLCVPLEEK